MTHTFTSLHEYILELRNLSIVVLFVICTVVSTTIFLYMLMVSSIVARRAFLPRYDYRVFSILYAYS